MTKHTDSTTATTTGPCAAFTDALTRLERSLDAQILVSQDRCVDGLLDLYNAAPTELIRSLVADILDDIRHLSAVRASTVQGRLMEVTAATSVELAFC
ncbi:MAG: hypothetical protein OEY41_04175 [Acidimicrobiia bacterium]|nr:hypothetical protein [Acidimicrobiia bacterium]MDH4366445.1 hypothetical protein [Acidimicrobiia bacterium]MDH5289178.1 hypothetical protein [Acidimicrobiia bacterium]